MHWGLFSFFMTIWGTIVLFMVLIFEQESNKSNELYIKNLINTHLEEQLNLARDLNLYDRLKHCKETLDMKNDMCICRGLLDD